MPSTITALDDTATITAAIGSTFASAAPGVLANDIDTDGDPLTVVQFAASGQTPVVAGTIESGTYGNLTLNSDGSYNYTVTNLSGTAAVNDSFVVKIGGAITGNVLTNDLTHLDDRFTYSASDGHGDTASANLDVTLDLGTQTVTAEDIKGTYGELHLNTDGSFTYTADRHAHLPRNGIVTDTFTYHETDSSGATGDASLTIAVTQNGQVGTLGLPGQTLNGGNGRDLLNGSLGDQVLNGGRGADGLIGGPGDKLTGGLGSDTFTFTGNFGQNEITDYRYPDRIQLDKSEWGTIANVLQHAADDGAGNTIITDPLNSANTITLDHVTVSQLQAHDFHLL